MRIIPAIDIIDGKCVRLSKGDYRTQKTYRSDPVEVAREFEDHGIRFLHLVDLDGARTKAITNQAVLEKITAATQLKVDVGGGIRSDKGVLPPTSPGASSPGCSATAATGSSSEPTAGTA